MAVSIDERVVEMRFNNKQFEEGVKKSMKSLNDLDQSIDKLDNNGLDNLVAKLNNVDFGQIERSLGSLEKRFSTFGVIGMSVIQKLTNGVIDLVGWMGKAVAKPFDIMQKGGWQRALNIENAKFQLKGLGIAWEKVSDDINYAVDGTAYGLDAAAKACSQLSASGVQAGEDMKKALRGISGVAAMANTEYENIAPIFTTVAGQGKLMTMQLRQLESRGLNAAAELGKALGKTEQQVRDMVTDGKIDFKTFADAMDEAFGEHAKDANQTFEGSLANMKAALKKIGAEVATEIMQDSVDLFNALREAINLIKVEILPIIQNKINPAIKTVIKGLAVAVSMISKSQRFKEFIRDIGEGLSDIINALKSSAFDIFINLSPVINNLRDIGEAISVIYQNITGSDKKLRVSVILIKILNGLLNGIFILLNGLTFVVKNVMETLANSGLGGFIKTYLLPLAKIILPAIIAALILSKLHMLKIVGVIAAITTAVMVLIRLDILKYVLGIAKGIGVIAMALGSIVALLVGKVISIVELIRNFGFKEAISNLRVELVNFFSTISTGAVSAAKGLVGGVLYILATPIRLIQSLINFILTTEGPLGRVRDFVVTVFGVVKKNGGLVLGFVQGLLQGLSQTKPVFLLVGAAMIAMLGIFTGLIKAITAFSTAFGNLTEAFKELSKIPSQITGTLQEMAKSAEIMAKAELRKQTVAMIIAFAGALVVLAAAAAIITKLVPNPYDFLVVCAGISAMGLAIVAIIGVANMFKAKVEALKKATEDVNNVFQSITAIGKQFAKDVAKSIMIKAIGNFLVSTAILVGTLTASLIILNRTIPDSRYISDVVSALALFVAAIGTTASIIAYFASKSMATGVAIAAFSALFLSISSSFLIMAVAIKQFQELSVDMDKLVRTLVAIGGASIALIAITALVAQAFKNVSMNIAALAVSVAALVIVMKTAPQFIYAFGMALTSVLNAFQEITWQQGSVIALILGVIGAVLVGMTAISRMATHGIRMIFVVISVIGALVAMLYVLKKLGEDKNSIGNIVDAFNDLWLVLGGVSVCLSLIFAAAGKAKYALRAMLLLGSLPLTLIAFIGEFKLLEMITRDMSSEALNKVLEVIAGFGIVMSAILAFSGLAGQKAWATVLSLSTTIVALTFCVGALAMLYDAAPIQTIQGAATLIAAILSLTLLMKAIGGANGGFNGGKNPIMGTLLALTLIIAATGVLAATILNITTDWKAIAAAFLGFDSILIAMAITVDILGHVVQSLGAFDKKKIGRVVFMFSSTMVAIILAAVAMRIALSGNENVNWSSLAAAAIGMSVMLLAMALVVNILASITRITGYSFKRILQACTSLLVVSLALWPIAWAIQKLAGLDYAKMLASAGSLSLVLLMMTGALAILGKFGGGKGEDLIMIAAGLTMLGVALGVLAGGLSLLAQFDEGRIWAAAGAILVIVGAMTLVTGALVLFPEAAVAIVPTLGALSLAFISAAASAAIIALAITAITGALTFFLSFLVKNKDTIAEALTAFGEGILGFITNVSESIKIAAVKTAEMLIRVLVVLVEGLFEILDRAWIGLVKLGDDIVIGIRKFLTTVADQMATGAYNGMILLAAAVSDGFKAVKAIIFKGEDVGKWIRTSFIKGLADKNHLVYQTAYAVGDSGFQGLYDGSTTGSLSKAIMDIGGWMDKSLIVGLADKADKVYDASYAVGNGAYEGLHKGTTTGSYSRLIGEMGGWMDSSLITGMESGKDAVYNTGVDVGNSAFAGILEAINGSDKIFEIQSGGLIDKVRNFFTDLTGANTGRNKSSGGGKVGSSIGEAIGKGGIKGALDYVEGKGKDKLVDVFGDLGETLGGETGRGIADKILESVGLTNKLVTEQELYNQALKKTSNMLIYNQTFRKKALKEAKEMSTKNVKVSPESTAVYMKEVQKQYDNLASQASGTGSWYTNLIRQIKDAADEIPLPNPDDFTSGLGDFSVSSGKAATNLDSLKQSLDSATAGFKEFDRSVNVTVADIRKNLKSQIKATEEFRMGLEVLAARGYSREVIEEILNMGVDTGYEYMAALVNDKSKKTVKEINKLYKKEGSLKKGTKKYLKDAYTKDGKHVSKAFLNGAKEELANYTMGDLTKTLTGKKLKQAFKKTLNGLDIKELTKNGKGALAKALNTYLDASASKSSKATKAFQEYITKAYLATLDEEQMQEALSKSSKKLAKDVNKWWKEQQKSVKESTLDQIRSMEDLTNAYKKTGKELLTEYGKQGADYMELQADRQYVAVAAKLAGASKEAIDYIMNTMSVEDILGFIELASEVGGEKAGKMFMKKFNIGMNSETIDFDVTISGKNQEELRRLLNDLGGQVTDIKDESELFQEALGGIEDGVKTLITSGKELELGTNKIVKSDKKLVEMTKVIAGAFLGDATAALNSYMLSLIDYDTVLEEVKVTGVDVTEVIQSQLTTVSDSVLKWKDSLSSSLKSALQSFDAFEEGEKKSFAEMTKNLENNVTKLNEWRAMIKRMESMGYSSDVIEAMTSKGISSYSEVEALTGGDITSAQVDHINQMWEQIGKESEKAADESLGAVALAAGDSGVEAIEKLKASATEELKKTKNDPELTKAATEAGYETGKTVGNGIAYGISDSGEVILRSVKEQVTAYKDKVAEESKKAYNATLENRLKQAQQLIYERLKATGMSMQQINTVMKKAGIQSIEGYVKGLTSYDANKFASSGVSQVVYNIVNTVMRDLDIHSPSKKFQWIGEMCGEGLAMGFRDSSYTVEDELGTLDDKLISYAQALLDDINSITDDDNAFTIKPILDLDNLQNANSQIQSLLGNGDIAVRSNMLAGSISTNSDWNMLSKALSGIGGNETTNTYGDTTIVVNPPAGSNSREIAQMVMGEIQRQMDRRQRV